ncbi:hypothetical protein DPMN_029624 [Dreissena polymorpha]|uniref:Uncharacterized protein n=1 Tax=Dreissena polymorpha TaxID=45954 RepID=A0A9D4LZK2_DREPO|nr:hypothetical protein DPMN_029624 [Dreissena polymorpha]
MHVAEAGSGLQIDVFVAGLCTPPDICPLQTQTAQNPKLNHCWSMAAQSRKDLLSPPRPRQS